MSAKFIGYERNEDPESLSKGFLGVGTVSVETDVGVILLNYAAKKGKDGNGIFIKPLVTKLNGVWIEGHVLDSNIASKDIDNMIRKAMNKNVVDDSTCPF